LSEAEATEVERLVNSQIRANAEVITRLMTPEKAIEEGAMALFGEKYGDEVRVLSMGSDEGRTYSTELCGGTHARRLGDIALFKVVSESAVAAGVRRVEGVTGAGALAYLNEFHRVAREAASVIRSTPTELPERITQLMDERRKLERELSEARRQLAMGGGGGGNADDGVQDINGVKLMARALEGIDPKDLRALVDQSKQKLGSGVIVLATASDGKAALVVGVTEDLAKKFNAVDLLKKAVEAVGGKGGGGRPDMAQGGGPDGSKLQAALDAVTAAVRDAKA
jgi:alanyl-tRNA synthetase